MSDSRYYTDLLLHRPQLFRAVLEANRAQSAPRPDAGLPAGFRGSVRDVHLRRSLRHKSDGYATVFLDFAAETSRFLFASPAEIAKALLLTGASLCGSDAARLVGGGEVRKLKAAIGNEAYTFAIRRGRFGAGALEAAAGRAAGIFSSPAEKVLRIAALTASAVLSDAGSDVEPLLAKHLEEALGLIPGMKNENTAGTPDMRPSAGSLSETQNRALRRMFKQILLKEAAPQWAPCFD